LKFSTEDEERWTSKEQVYTADVRIWHFKLGSLRHSLLTISWNAGIYMWMSKG